MEFVTRRARGYSNEICVAKWVRGGSPPLVKGEAADKCDFPRDGENATDQSFYRELAETT